MNKVKPNIHVTTKRKSKTMFSKLNPIRNRRRNGRTGATALEFAMVAPAFLIVIAVCIEFARLSMLRNTSHNACYEACRFIMTEGASVADGRETAQAVLDRIGTVEATILINGADGSLDSDGNVIGELDFDTETVEAEIVIPLAENTFVIPGAVLGDRSIRTRMSMRTERYAGFFDAEDAD